MRVSFPSLREFGRRNSPSSRSSHTKARRAGRRVALPGPECLEQRLTLTGNISITDAYLVDWEDTKITATPPLGVGQMVEVQAEFTTQDLPSNATYKIAFTVDGHTQYSDTITYGAGVKQKESWQYPLAVWVAAPGKNQIVVTVDPDHTVPETSYADNVRSDDFTAGPTAVGSSFSPYTVSQVRSAYGLNSIPAIGPSGEAADGSGQTIAIVDTYNDPSIITDLEGFDKRMYLSTNSGQTLAAYNTSQFLNVYNQQGKRITSEIDDPLSLSDTGNSQTTEGVPPVGYDGNLQEITLDVEWAHAMAPGAHIDLIECDGATSDYFQGVKTAAGLSGVTEVSMSWGIYEAGEGAPSGESLSSQKQESDFDSEYFAHSGVTFLGASGDGGAPSDYPALSPNVVGVGATQLAMNGDAYVGETGWSLPAPRVVTSSGSSTWTTTITAAADQGDGGGTVVSATWAASPNNSAAASYSIYDVTTNKTLGNPVIVDQTKAPVGTVVANPSGGSSQYQELGYYFFNTGDTLKVVLNGNPPSNSTAADTIGVAPGYASGGGPSEFAKEPAYQLPFQTTGFRTAPDVSFDGSNQSGMICYEGGTFKFNYWGTSLATPCWAGIIAIANQERKAEGVAPLNSAGNPTQTLQALYSLPARDFHVVTPGYNGIANPMGENGYNEVTGRGSPIANLLIPDLASFGIPSRLAITSQPPASVTAGKDFGLKVTVEDDLGNVATSYNGPVTIALRNTPIGGTLVGTTTVMADDGIATFANLSLPTAGTKYTLRATVGGLTAATTNDFTVTPAAAHQLVVTSEPPSSVIDGATFGLTIKAEDRYGNVATSFDADVTMTLPPEIIYGLIGLSLDGMVTTTVIDGVVTFTGLRLRVKPADAGGSYGLVATSGGLVSATTTKIKINA